MSQDKFRTGFLAFLVGAAVAAAMILPIAIIEHGAAEGFKAINATNYNSAKSCVETMAIVIKELEARGTGPRL